MSDVTSPLPSGPAIILCDSGLFPRRTEILYLLEHHSTVVIIGETGSGKTTQLPQYLREAGWAAGGRCIVCTQPRCACWTAQWSDAGSA